MVAGRVLTMDLTRRICGSGISVREVTNAGGWGGRSPVAVVTSKDWVEGLWLDPDRWRGTSLTVLAQPRRPSLNVKVGNPPNSAGSEAASKVS